MKKIILLLLSAALVLSMLAFLSSCGECTEHTDSNKDGKCDNCGKTVEVEHTEHVDEDGDKVCDVCLEILVEDNKPTNVSVTFTVTDQENAAVPGAVVSFTAGGKTVKGTADAQGKFTLTLATGSYSLEYEFDGYYYGNTNTANINASTETLTLKVTNNTPNGTQTRPFPLTVGENELTVPANTSYYYIVYRAVNLIATVEGAGAKVTYGDDVYTIADEAVSFDLEGTSTNSAELILIENTLDDEAVFGVEINSRPGTQGNPYVIEALGDEISLDGLTEDDIVYYSYTALEAGTLKITVTSDNTVASVLNTSNSVANSTSATGTREMTIAVAAGDRIVIDLATTLKENATVSFIIEALSE